MDARVRPAKRLATGLAAALAGGLAFAATPARADVFGAFFAESGQPRSCYARSYTKSHLANHPRQQTLAISLSPAFTGNPPSRSHGFGLRVAVDLRQTRETLVGFGYCTLEGAQAACSMEGDAGLFALSITAAGRMRLETRSIAFEGTSGFHVVGSAVSDDGTFLLDRLPAGNCRP